MDETSPIHHYPEGHVALSVEELSQHARVSRAFIRLCIVNGCPTIAGKLSEATLIDWLTRNYAKVRAAAGLGSMAPLAGLAPAAFRDLRLANTMLTLLEFSATRSSNRMERRQIRKVMRLVERSV